MELSTVQNQLSSPAVAIVTNTLPSLSTDGVDVTSWKQGGMQYARFLVELESDGTARTVAAPTGGQGGPEVWTYRKDAAGAFKWWIIAYLNNGVTANVPAAGGKVEGVQSVALGDRIYIAGTVAAGTVTYTCVPVEFDSQFMS